MLREKLVWWDWIIYYLISKVEIILEAKSQRKYYMTFPPWQKENQVFLDDLKKNPCRINILSGGVDIRKLIMHSCFIYILYKNIVLKILYAVLALLYKDRCILLLVTILKLSIFNFLCYWINDLFYE